MSVSALFLHHLWEFRIQNYFWYSLLQPLLVIPCVSLKLTYLYSCIQSQKRTVHFFLTGKALLKISTHSIHFGGLEFYSSPGPYLDWCFNCFFESSQSRLELCSILKIDRTAYICIIWIRHLSFHRRHKTCDKCRMSIISTRNCAFSSSEFMKTMYSYICLNFLHSCMSNSADTFSVTHTLHFHDFSRRCSHKSDPDLWDFWLWQECFSRFRSSEMLHHVNW